MASHASTTLYGESGPERTVLGGKRRFTDQLFVRVYERLRCVARQERLRWGRQASLNTTALVHEAYLRIVAGAGLDLESRRHALRVAVRAMRYVLIDRAKARRRQKRGGDRRRVAFDEALAVTVDDEVLLAIDAALHRLHEIHPRQGRIVECRFFAGLSIEDTAALLGLSPATVKRDWAAARAWLYRELGPSGSP